MSETTCIHKWDWRKYGPCTMCGTTPIIATDCAATRTVNIAEIIEQVLALRVPDYVGETCGFHPVDVAINSTISHVVQILERYR